MDTLEQYVDRDLSKLTQAELLWLWRRRQLSKHSKRKPTRQSTVRRMGRMMTREEASEALGVSENAYARLEVGDALLSSDEKSRVRGALAAMAGVVVGELCAVARRRSGGGLRAAEEALGVSRPKMQEMERCGDPRLVRYWESKGFGFP